MCEEEDGWYKKYIEQMRDCKKQKWKMPIRKIRWKSLLLLWQCAKGHEPWEATPAHVKSGTW